MNSLNFIQKISIAILFLLSVVIILVHIPPHFSLAIGLIIGLTVGNPIQKLTKPITKYLLQGCVIGLGFGMDFMKVVDAGKTGILFTIITIAGALGLGLLLGKFLKVPHKITYLISCGTAICGGSAIAAVSPAMEAEEKEISMAMATVFTLNAIALLLFPYIGHTMDLSQQQFGLWAAIAIHDTSSVVGAASAYGDEALTIATTVKLARALWIIPMVIVTALIFGKKAGVKSFPIFILLFVLATLATTYLKIPKDISARIVDLSKSGLSITLLLIGANISVKNIRETGIKALFLGFLLWLILLVGTLIVVINF
ncbi:MAG: YeiH family protein [Bacteroidia bacterium]